MEDFLDGAVVSLAQLFHELHLPHIDGERGAVGEIDAGGMQDGLSAEAQGAGGVAAKCTIRAADGRDKEALLHNFALDEIFKGAAHHGPADGVWVVAVGGDASTEAGIAGAAGEGGGRRWAGDVVEIELEAFSAACEAALCTAEALWRRVGGVHGGMLADVGLLEGGVEGAIGVVGALCDLSDG